MEWDAELQSVIGDIYDTALDPERWPRVLGRLGPLFDGLGAVLISHDLPRREVTFGRIGGLPGDSFAAYATHYVRVNPRLDFAARRPPGSIMHDALVLEERAMNRSEFYNDFLKPFGMRYEIGANLIHTGRHLAGIAVERPDSAGPPTETEVAAFAQLVPHLQRALLLQSQLARTETGTRTLLNALDSLPMAVMLVDGHCRLRSANRAAERMLAESDGLASTRDGLRAGAIADTTTLRRLVAEAARTAAGASLRGGGEMQLVRPSGAMPLAVRIIPVGSANPLCFDRPRPCVALFVSDPEQSPRPSADVVARLYGLTAKQARLLAALAEGLTLEEAAERFGVTRDAVRKQLQRLFRKTGTKRQKDLVRLVTSGPAMIAARK